MFTNSNCKHDNHRWLNATAVLAMRQIPRSTKCISSYILFSILLILVLAYYETLLTVLGLAALVSLFEEKT